jgi:acetyl esterase/lipase
MSYRFTSFYLDRPFVNGRIYDLFEPDAIKHDTAFFIVHGGGWRAGSRGGYHVLMQELVKRGYIVASTDYRLNGSIFDQIKDIREAYMHFVNELRKMNRPLKIAVHGSTAGAHLASLLAFARPGECGEDLPADMEWIQPECVALQATPSTFEPWFEIFPHVWTAMQSIMCVSYEEDPAAYRKVSLNQYVRSGLPRVFYLEAACEHMFPAAMNLELAKKITALEGNHVTMKSYANMEHGFMYSLERPHQIEAFDDMVRFAENEPIENTFYCV